MNWEQKFAALNAICDHSIMMRSPGDWYVTGRIEIAGDGFLRSPTHSEKSPEEAVNMRWSQLVDDLKPDEYLLGGSPGHTVAVRWNGYMWADASCMRKKHVSA